MIAWPFSWSVIEHALGELAQRVEVMSKVVFLAQHEMVHAQAWGPTIDLVASVHERAFWRRWPEGRKG